MSWNPILRKTCLPWGKIRDSHDIVSLSELEEGEDSSYTQDKFKYTCIFKIVKKNWKTGEIDSQRVSVPLTKYNLFSENCLNFKYLYPLQRWTIVGGFSWERGDSQSKKIQLLHVLSFHVLVCKSFLQKICSKWFGTSAACLVFSGPLASIIKAFNASSSSLLPESSDWAWWWIRSSSKRRSSSQVGSPASCFCLIFSTERKKDSVRFIGSVFLQSGVAVVSAILKPQISRVFFGKNCFDVVDFYRNSSRVKTSNVSFFLRYNTILRLPGITEFPPCRQFYAKKGAYSNTSVLTAYTFSGDFDFQNLISWKVHLTLAALSFSGEKHAGNFNTYYLGESHNLRWFITWKLQDFLVFGLETLWVGLQNHLCSDWAQHCKGFLHHICFTHVNWFSAIRILKIQEKIMVEKLYSALAALRFSGEKKIDYRFVLQKMLNFGFSGAAKVEVLL